MYLDGHGTKKDFAKALELFKRCEDKKIPLAFNNLGAMY